MQVKDYIQGDKRGKAANRLEREAMNDRFLQEALEGFDTVPGNHTAVIERLEKKIIPPAIVPKNNRKVLYFSSMAASILLIIGFGVYYLLDRNVQKPAIALVQTVQEEEIESALSESVPPPPAYAGQMDIPASAASAGMQATQALPHSIRAQDIQHDAIERATIIEDNVTVGAQEEQVVAQTHTPPVSAEEAIAEEKAVPAEAEYAAAKRSSVSAADAKEVVANAKPAATTFGKKEFQAYCLKNAAKNICGSQSVSVRVSFYVDAAGKPTNIKCDRYTCENAKKEIERLLSVSPAWTTINKQITMIVTMNRD